MISVLDVPSCVPSRPCLLTCREFPSLGSWCRADASAQQKHPCLSASLATLWRPHTRRNTRGHTLEAMRLLATHWRAMRLLATRSKPCRCLPHTGGHAAVGHTLEAMRSLATRWGPCGCLSHAGGYAVVCHTLEAMRSSVTRWGPCGHLPHAGGHAVTCHTAGAMRPCAALQVLAMYGPS